MQPTGTAKAEAQCLITPLPLTNLNPRAGKWAIFGPKSLLRVGVPNDVNVPYCTKHESIYLKSGSFPGLTQPTCLESDLCKNCGCV